MNRKEHLLIILAEECAEVSKEVSKALRFGLDDCNPNVILEEANITNSERITKEIADITGILEMLYSEKIIERPMLYDILEKKKKIKSFLNYSKTVGTLND